MPSLWSSSEVARWREALDRYPSVIAAQGVKSLAELDAWYRDTLPGAIGSRVPAHVTPEELARLTRWKMSRGEWRPRNLQLVEGNDPELVVATSVAALAAVPDPRKPIRILSELAGVGPATASAVVAAYRPDLYPFLDDTVAQVIPSLGAPAFTLPFYRRYAEALRERAAELGAGWTPVTVERALWADVHGEPAA